MSAVLKPLRMCDLPGRIYRCVDEEDRPHVPPRKDSFSTRLSEMEIGDTMTIPKTSQGMLSRIAKRTGFVFQRQALDDKFMTVLRRK